MTSWTFEQWLEAIDQHPDKVGYEDYYAIRRWETECCARALEKMYPIAKSADDSELMQDLHVLGYVVLHRIALDQKRLDELPPINVKVNSARYRAAWEQSRTGSQKEVAAILGVDVSTLRRWLKKHPGEKLQNKNRA
jgi:hypothetical protein